MITIPICRRLLRATSSEGKGIVDVRERKRGAVIRKVIKMTFSSKHMSVCYHDTGDCECAKAELQLEPIFNDISSVMCTYPVPSHCSVMNSAGEVLDKFIYAGPLCARQSKMTLQMNYRHELNTQNESDLT